MPMQKRLTQISQPQFKKLYQGMLDGSLLKKWQGHSPTSKSEKVEERQIRLIGLVLSDASKETKDRLLGNDFDNLILLSDGKNMTLQIEYRGGLVWKPRRF